MLFCPRAARAEKRVSAREIVRKLPGAWTGPGSARKLEIARSWDIEVQVRAISSVVERLLHTQEVAGSNPASRTILDCPGWRETCRVVYNLLPIRGLALHRFVGLSTGLDSTRHARDNFMSLFCSSRHSHTNWISRDGPERVGERAIFRNVYFSLTSIVPKDAGCSAVAGCPDTG